MPRWKEIIIEHERKSILLREIENELAFKIFRDDKLTIFLFSKHVKIIILPHGHRIFNNSFKRYIQKGRNHKRSNRFSRVLDRHYSPIKGVAITLLSSTTLPMYIYIYSLSTVEWTNPIPRTTLANVILVETDERILSSVSDILLESLPPMVWKVEGRRAVVGQF